MLLRGYLRGQAVARPDHIAYIAGSERRTWAEVWERSARLASALIRLGVTAGDVVAFLGQDGFEQVETWFASAMLGTLRVGLNWRYSPKEMAHVLRDSGASVLIVGDTPTGDVLAQVLGPGLPCLRWPIGFGAHDQELDYEELLACSEALLPGAWPPITPGDPVAVSYTTGTTGLPKGAVWSHAAVVEALVNTALQAGFRRTDTFLHCLPAAGVPILAATWNVVNGSTTVLLPRYSPASALKAIADHHVTYTLLVPTMITDLLAHPLLVTTDLSTLRLIIYGSAPATPALVRRTLSVFGCELQQWYGSTEGTGGWFTMLHHDDHQQAIGTDPDLLKSCGRPTAHVEIQVISERGDPLPTGEIGEIAVRTGTALLRYTNLPEATASALTPDGWLRTGDLGRLDQNGYLYLVDRKNFMIITGGYNVYPVVIENALAEHPAVAEVAVVGIPDERWGEAVCAVVVIGQPVTEDELIAHCSQRLGSFEIPKRIVLADKLARGTTGKILKREVRAELIGRLTETQDLEASPTVWVPKTCATWADVLQMAAGSVRCSASAGPVLAWPEVGGSSACGLEAGVPDRVPCGAGAGLVAPGVVVERRGELDAAPSTCGRPARAAEGQSALNVAGPGVAGAARRDTADRAPRGDAADRHSRHDLALAPRHRAPPVGARIAPWPFRAPCAGRKLLQVTFPDDQHPVSAFGADRAHEAFCVGVRPHRQPRLVQMIGIDVCW
jgi:acyl-CoA synthetase (AMP-forming)/AMP-acid ligase II